MRAPRLGFALAAFVYALVTALLFSNLLPVMRTELFSDVGDPLLNTAILAWNARQTPLTGAWWNFPSFAPLTGVTAFTEHLLLAYPIATPIVRATGNAVLAHNVVFVLAPILNGLAAFALARELRLSIAAALVAGAAFAFAPYQSVQLSHVQLMLAFGMPLALAGLHRYLGPPEGGADRPGRAAQGLAMFAAGWLATEFANAYVLIFFPLLVVLWCLWFIKPREWRRVVPLVVTAVVTTLPVVPLLWGYHVRQTAYGIAREYNEVKSFSADIIGLTGMYHRAVPWRGLLPHNFEEGALFPGFTTIALAIVAVAIAWRSPAGTEGAAAWRSPKPLLKAAIVLTAIVLARVWTGPYGWHIGPLPLPPFSPYRLFTIAALLYIAAAATTTAFRSAWRRGDAVMFYAVATIVFWLIALGPEPALNHWRALTYGPYRLLFALPGFTAIRVPARAWLPAVLCLAMLAGFGASAVLRRFPRFPIALTVVLLAAVAAEGWFTDNTAAAPKVTIERAIPSGALVLDLPADESLFNTIPQYRAVMRGYRTINGYSGYQPPFFTPLRHAIAELRPGALDQYRKREDLWVIVRPGEDPLVADWIANHQPGGELIYKTGDGIVFRLPRLP